MQIHSAPFNSPPEWLLRIDTHLHCSTLVSLLLEPNTVLGPMYLIKTETVINRTTSSSSDFLFKENQLHSTLVFYVQLLLQWKLKKKIRYVLEKVIWVVKKLASIKCTITKDRKKTVTFKLTLEISSGSFLQGQKKMPQLLERRQKRPNLQYQWCGVTGFSSSPTGQSGEFIKRKETLRDVTE